MKKMLCVILTLALCVSGAFALAEERPEVEWTYPVPLMDIDSEYAILVNEEHLLDSTFKPDPLVKVTGVKRATSAAVYLQETAAEAIKSMFEAAALVTEYTYTNEKGKSVTATYNESTGMVLYLKSGYRSYGTQQTVYANYLARNNNVDDGYSAKPGASEHQSGLCADILNEDYASRTRMTQDFKWTAEAQWMKENCADFGLILRFTEDGEAETGIKFEPWHFRYVGKNAASYIMAKGMTLEAFYEEAQAAIQDYVDEGGDVEAQKAFEYARMNKPPESYLTDEVGEDGDPEVSIVF